MADRPLVASRVPGLFLLVVVGVLVGLWGAPVLAEPAIPKPLEPWVPWVLDSHPELACPLVGEARVCVWPGVLELELDDRGGRFELAVFADRELDLTLPGGAAFFPREVQVDGRAALLRRVGEVPALLLPRGEHRITGSFRWPRLPESLPVPREIALVDLRLRGERVSRPHRESGGLLWLQARESEASEEDGLTLEVHRHIGDGVPARLETRLLLRVSGTAREIDLGEILPADFEPYQLESGLPARYGRDRRLRVQLRAGEWSLRLLARSRGPLAQLAYEPRPAPWPEEEIWVFAADPAIRAVRVDGASSIDPQRTSLPEEWKSLPAFQMVADTALTFEELRRGEPEPPPDEVSVTRTFWLALAGDRFTARDQMSGTLQQGGRLEILAPAQLGRAALGGADQVISSSPTGGGAGVEVRSGALTFEADAIYPRGGELPAVGWNRDVSLLKAELRVPPGWSLLTASGVDIVRGAWVDNWTLLDFFLLLIVVLAIFKLYGPLAGGIALPALVLSWQERYALVLVWLLLGLLVLRGIELLRPEGSVRRLLRLGLTVALLVTLVLFVRWQWRTGRYPHLDRTQGQITDLFSSGALAYSSAASPEQAEYDAVDRLEVASPQPQRKMSEGSQVGGNIGDYNTYQVQKRSRQVDPNAVVQTGPGVPAWTWRSFYLIWQGPVKADHALRLYLISPFQELVLSILRIGLFLALTAWLLGWRGGWPGTKAAEDDDGEPTASRSSVVTTAVLVFCLLAGQVFYAGTATAEEPVAPGAPSLAADGPGPDLLQELERRLTRPPECAPQCVELSRLDLKASAGGLTIEADVHAASDTAWALPGPAASFVPTEVLVDGRAAVAIRLQEDGFLALRLPRGVHRVLLRGPARDSVSLQFQIPPRVLSFTGEGFTLDGFREDEPPPSLVRIDRTLPREEAGEAAEVELAPWLELGRRLDIGLPWMIHYRLSRLSPGGAAVLLRVPLLPGEAVTTAGVSVEGGEALISLEPGETVREWSTTLTERPSLTLESPVGRPWLERWELLCSPIWHCQAQGLAPISHMTDGEWRPSWRPWPGEKLELAFVRPEGAPGQTTTLDHVKVYYEPGRRLLEGRLVLHARASRGGEQKIGLPADAELLSFEIDEKSVPVQNLNGQVVYTLEPGSRTVVLKWRQDYAAGLFQKMPAIEIPGEAANLWLSVQRPDHRWLLWTGGPDWGPVVLFWQDLVAIALASLVLARFGKTPLKALDWTLLGVGLTQVPLPFAVIVVLWLLALAWKKRPEKPWRHDLFQLVLLFFGLVTIGTLYAAIHSGLLGTPDMRVSDANPYTGEMMWQDERVSGSLPQPWLLWVPMFVYRTVMLLWALWLASRLLRWLPWCWQQLYREGKLFRLPEAWKNRRNQPPQASPPVQPSASGS